MRICVVSGSFPTMRCGVADQVWHLSRHLCSLGHEVTVVTSRNARTEEGAAESSDVRVLPVIDSWRRPEPLLSVLAETNCEVIQLDYQTALYGRHPMVNRLPAELRRAGILRPLVTRFHDLWGPRLFPGAGRLGLRTSFVAALARDSAAALVSNERHRDQLLGLLGVNAGNVLEVPLGPGVPPSARPAEVAEVRDELGVGETGLLGGYFGLIQPGTGKGVDLLLRALAQISDRRARWVIIGGAASAAGRRHEVRLRAFAADAGLAERLHWTGYVAAERASALLSACDLCVLPFEDGAELHRSSLITALAHRVPVVTTVAGRLPAVLTDGVHLLAAPAGDAARLGQKIAELLASRDLRAQLRDNLAPLAERLSWPSLARTTQALYAEVCSSGDGVEASRLVADDATGSTQGTAPWR